MTRHFYPAADRLDLTKRFKGFDALETPTVVVDESTLAGNIEHMRAVAGEGTALHPHVKTHKSLEIAQLQRRFGAAGFTAARPWEAMVLLKSGLGPVTLAYPQLSPAPVSRLIEAARDGVVRFIADSPASIEAIAKAAVQSGRRVAVFLKVDVGLHRCGVDPSDERALQLAGQIARHPLLDFAGLLSHAGHAYGASDPEAIRAVAETERDILFGLRDRLQAAGIPVPTISVGSTPSVLANAGFDGIDEIRPGNYVFRDLTAVRLGLAERDDVALGVSARIMVCNAYYAIADVGSKTLSSDLGAHGTSGTSTYGEAWIPGRDVPLRILKLSEEHAFLELGSPPVEPGTAILVLPNHACPVANLSRGMTMLDAAGTPRALAVEAAGHAAM